MFLIVPGNHDVEKNKIDFYLEKGLKQELASTDSIDKFFKSTPGDIHFNRILHFNNLVNLIHGENTVKNKISYSKIINKQGKKIGFSCLSSAWRSIGEKTDRGNLIIGKWQIDNLFNDISDCDLKICLMHHPIEYLVEDDMYDVERALLNNFDIVLNGHLHSLDIKNITSIGKKTLFSTCGRLYPYNDYYNGYSIMKVNFYNKECSILLREYFPKRQEFDKASSISKTGLEEFKVECDNRNFDFIYDFIIKMKKEFSKQIHGFNTKYDRPVITKKIRRYLC